MIRALYRSVDVPGEGQAHARFTYLGDAETLDAARLTGVVGAASGRRPVVIVLPGINVPPDAYTGLATHLAPHATVVTYSLLGNLGPVGEGITPGIDITAAAPDVIGTRPSATALGPLLDLARRLDESDPVLAGTLDTDTVVVVGHSAGGTVALQNADPEWFPGLAGVATYAGHTMTAMSLGHDAAAVVPTASVLPTLLVSGELDGVIAESAERYGVTADEHDPVRRTFDDAIVADHGSSWFVELAGATHFCPCEPPEELSGRMFLDPADAPDQAPLREHFFELLTAFLAACTGGSGDAIDQLCAHDAVNTWTRR